MRNRVVRAGVGVAIALLALVIGAVPADAVPTVTKAAALQVDADNDMQISPGDTLRYTVQITDTGTANAVAFGDPIPDPNTMLVAGTVTTTQGTVLSGNGAGETVVGVNAGTISNQTVTITFDVTIKNPLPAGVNSVGDQGGIGCDTCGAGIPTDDPNTAAANDPTITAVVAAADLTVTKTDALQVDADNDMQVSPGDTLRYTVSITNSGNQDATAVFSDAIPDPNTMLVVGSVATTLGVIVVGNTAGDTAVVVNLGTVVGGGGTATITFDTTINNPLPAGVTQVGDQGAVECPTCSPQVQPTDDPSTAAVDDPTLTAVVAEPDLSVTKTDTLQVDADNDMQVSPGDTLRYTVTITNSGNEGASAVFIDGIPDPNTALVVGSVATTFGTITMGNNVADTAVAVDLANLAGGGGSATITFDVTIDNPLPAFVTQVGDQAGVVCTNCTTPEIPSDDPDTATPDDPTITPVIAAPEVSATKAVTLEGSSTPALLVISNSILQYTVVLTNSGNQDAAAVVFFDQPAAGNTLLVGSVTTTLGVVVSGNNPGDTAVAVQIPTLGGGGGTATIMYRTQVDSLATGTSVTLENQGSVTGANFSPTVTDNPNTPAVNDPTAVVAIGPAPAPVLGSFGLAFAIILLVGVAGVRMRRASSAGRAE